MGLASLHIFKHLVTCGYIQIAPVSRQWSSTSPKLEITCFYSSQIVTYLCAAGIRNSCSSVTCRVLEVGFIREVGTEYREEKTTFNESVKSE